MPTSPQTTGEFLYGSSEQRDASFRRTLCRLAIAIAVLLSSFVTTRVGATPPNPSSLTPDVVDAWIANNQLAEATQALQDFDAPSSPDDWTRTLAQLATKLHHAGDTNPAAEFFARAVVASTSDASQSIGDDKKSLLRLSAAPVMLKAARPDAALGTLGWIFDNDTDAQRIRGAAQLLVTVGSTAIAQGDHKTARDAYALAAKHLTGDLQAAAKLGHGWSLAISQSDPEEAAQSLQSFANEFPEHTDAPRAMRASASCWQQAGQPARADTTLIELLNRWPKSAVALDVVNAYLAPTSTGVLRTVPAFIAQWISDQTTADNTGELSDRVYAAGLRSDLVFHDAVLLQRLAAGLAVTDKTGQLTTETLQFLVQQEHPEIAERIATSFIAPGDGDILPTAREAAGRWAGRHERWTMLALAAQDTSPEQADPSRTVGLERLFAEGLMQIGRAAEARAWWNHLVDRRQVDDFPTLLRCAETAVSHGEVAEAISRVKAAEAQAGQDAFRRALIGMLAADLAIRRLNFDDARAHLEQIVRSSADVGSLRPRAQWLIGETFFMQQRFADAVDAYRTVEGIDPGGEWCAPALVQAGKSFEQLGRTREAAVCYSNLLGQYADSPHAHDAKRRLAALNPSASPSNDSLRR